MKSRPSTITQISAGGVTFRKRGPRVSVALISVGETVRWQLPKGLVDPGESPESAALREVREEAGIHAVILEPIDKIEYWYVATEAGERVRFHKFVHFYLMRYKSGSIRDNDHEVNEARWVQVDEAEEMLAFATERKVMARAAERISAMLDDDKSKKI